MQIFVTCDFWVSVIQLKFYIVGDAQASHVTYFAKHIAITQTSPNITSKYLQIPVYSANLVYAL